MKSCAKVQYLAAVNEGDNKAVEVGVDKDYRDNGNDARQQKQRFPRFKGTRSTTREGFHASPFRE